MAARSGWKDGTLALRVILLLVCTLDFPETIRAKFCKDKLCSEPISKAKAVYNYNGMSEEDLKLRPGDDVTIYSTSDDKQFVEGEVNGQRGIFPAKYIREFQVFANKDQLKQLPDEDPSEEESNSHLRKGNKHPDYPDLEHYGYDNDNYHDPVESDRTGNVRKKKRQQRNRLEDEYPDDQRFYSENDPYSENFDDSEYTDHPAVKKKATKKKGKKTRKVAARKATHNIDNIEYVDDPRDEPPTRIKKKKKKKSKPLNKIVPKKAKRSLEEIPDEYNDYPIEDEIPEQTDNELYEDVAPIKPKKKKKQGKAKTKKSKSNQRKEHSQEEQNDEEPEQNIEESKQREIRPKLEFSDDDVSIESLPDSKKTERDRKLAMDGLAMQLKPEKPESLKLHESPSEKEFDDKETEKGEVVEEPRAEVSEEHAESTARSSEQSSKNAQKSDPPRTTDERYADIDRKIKDIDDQVKDDDTDEKVHHEEQGEKLNSDKSQSVQPDQQITETHAKTLDKESSGMESPSNEGIVTATDEKSSEKDKTEESPKTDEIKTVLKEDETFSEHGKEKVVEQNSEMKMETEPSKLETEQPIAIEQDRSNAVGDMKETETADTSSDKANKKDDNSDQTEPISEHGKGQEDETKSVSEDTPHETKDAQTESSSKEVPPEEKKENTGGGWGIFSSFLGGSDSEEDKSNAEKESSEDMKQVEDAKSGSTSVGESQSDSDNQGQPSSPTQSTDRTLVDREEVKFEPQSEDALFASSSSNYDEQLKEMPKFIGLRNKMMKDYLIAHYSGKMVTPQIRQMAEQLVTEDLLAQIKEPNSPLIDVIFGDQEIDFDKNDKMRVGSINHEGGTQEEKPEDGKTEDRAKDTADDKDERKHPQDKEETEKTQATIPEKVVYRDKSEEDIIKDAEEAAASDSENEMQSDERDVTPQPQDNKDDTTASSEPVDRSEEVTHVKKEGEVVEETKNTSEGGQGKEANDLKGEEDNQPKRDGVQSVDESQAIDPETPESETQEKPESESGAGQRLDERTEEPKTVGTLGSQREHERESGTGQRRKIDERFEEPKAVDALVNHSKTKNESAAEVKVVSEESSIKAATESLNSHDDKVVPELKSYVHEIPPQQTVRVKPEGIPSIVPSVQSSETLITEQSIIDHSKKAASSITPTPSINELTNTVISKPISTLTKPIGLDGLGADKILKMKERFKKFKSNVSAHVQKATDTFTVTKDLSSTKSYSTNDSTMKEPQDETKTTETVVSKIPLATEDLLIGKGPEARVNETVPANSDKNSVDEKIEKQPVAEKESSSAAGLKDIGDVKLATVQGLQSRQLLQSSDANKTNEEKEEKDKDSVADVKEATPLPTTDTEPTVAPSSTHGTLSPTDQPPETQSSDQEAKHVQDEKRPSETVDTDKTKSETIEDEEGLDRNEQLLRLCHENPTLQVCEELRGAKISRGNRKKPTTDEIDEPVRKEGGGIYGIFSSIMNQIKWIKLAVIRLIHAPLAVLGLGEAMESLHYKVEHASPEAMAITICCILLSTILLLKWGFGDKNNVVQGPNMKDIEKIYGSKVTILEEQRDELDAEVKKLKEMLEITEKKVAVKDSMIRELEHKLKDFTKKFADQERSRRAEALFGTSSTKRDSSTTSSERDSSSTSTSHRYVTNGSKEKNITTLKTEVKTGKETQDELKKLIDEKEIEIKEADAVALRHQQEIARQTEITGELNDRLEKFRGELDLKDCSMLELQDKVGTLHVEIENLLAERKQIEEEKLGIETRVKDLEETLRQKDEKEEAFDEELESKDHEIEVLRECLAHINNGKVQDSDVQNDFEIPEQDPEIKEQLKAERMKSILDSTKALTDLKKVQSENEVLTEALEDEIQERKQAETKAESLEKELDITSKNCKNYKSKAEELQIKLSTLQDYFRLQEIDLHRKLSIEEQARLHSEKKLENTQSESATAVQDLELLRTQNEDLRKEIKDMEKSFREKENGKDKEYHEVWIKFRQTSRELEEMKRERDVYRKRLLEAETTRKSSPLAVASTAPSEKGRRDSNGSAEDLRSTSPTSLKSGSSALPPRLIGPPRGPFGMPPPPPPPMYGGPIRPMPFGPPMPMGGPFPRPPPGPGLYGPPRPPPPSGPPSTVGMPPPSGPSSISSQHMPGPPVQEPPQRPPLARHGSGLSQKSMIPTQILQGSTMPVSTQGFQPPLQPRPPFTSSQPRTENPLGPPSQSQNPLQTPQQQPGIHAPPGAFQTQGTRTSTPFGSQPPPMASPQVTPPAPVSTQPTSQSSHHPLKTMQSPPGPPTSMQTNQFRRLGGQSRYGQGGI